MEEVVFVSYSYTAGDGTHGFGDTRIDLPQGTMPMMYYTINKIRAAIKNDLDAKYPAPLTIVILNIIPLSGR